LPFKKRWEKLSRKQGKIHAPDDVWRVISLDRTSRGSGGERIETSGRGAAVQKAVRMIGTPRCRREVQKLVLGLTGGILLGLKRENQREKIRRENIRIP